MLLFVNYAGIPQEGNLIVTLSAPEDDAEMKVSVRAEGSRLKVHALPGKGFIIPTGVSVEQHVVANLRQQVSLTTNLFAVIQHMLAQQLNIGFAYDLFNLLDKPRREFDRWLLPEYAGIPHLRAQAERAYGELRRQFRGRSLHIRHMWVNVEILPNAVVFALHGADDQPADYILSLNNEGVVRVHDGMYGTLRSSSVAAEAAVERVREHLRGQDMLRMMLVATLPGCILLQA